MKITPKPFKTHRDEPALKALVTAPVSPAAKELAYQQLITSQNVSVERAKSLLNLP